MLANNGTEEKFEPDQSEFLVGRKFEADEFEKVTHESDEELGSITEWRLKTITMVLMTGHVISVVRVFI